MQVYFIRAILSLHIKIIIATTPVTNENPPCRWSDRFGTCQASERFLDSQPFPEIMDLLIENIRDNNRCEMEGCPVDRCTFSDVYGHCVSYLSRWVMENRVPFFTLLFKRDCNMYNDQMLLGRYSPCMDLSEEKACTSKSKYCSWEPILTKNLTIGIGQNPCQVNNNLCFPKMRISECAHCWMRKDSCFRDCELYRGYLEGLRIKNLCWESYNSLDDRADCMNDELCWWDSDRSQCTARVSEMERGMEPGCPLTKLFDTEYREMMIKCLRLVDLQCNEEPDCEWARGPITLNGYCPSEIGGKWDEIPSQGECRVSDKMMVEKLFAPKEKRISDSYAYFMDTVRRCESQRNRILCESTQGWENFPEWLTETYQDPIDYLPLVFMVLGGIVGGCLCLGIFVRVAKILYYYDIDRLTSSSFLSNNYLTKVKPKLDSKWDIVSNVRSGRPLHCNLVSAEISGFEIVEGIDKRIPLTVDFQAPIETIDDSGNTIQPQGGSFICSCGDGRWSVSENILELTFEDTNQTFSVIATPEGDERVWTGPEGKKLVVMRPALLPEWFAPSVLSIRYEIPSTSEENYECPECYFSLYLFSVAVLRAHSKRVCPHYVHSDCAKYKLAQARLTNKDAHCSQCHSRFTEVRELPDLLKDAHGWFSAVDIDLSGTLDKREVEVSLGAVFPIDRQKLRQAINENWVVWDPNLDGDVSLEEFLSPGGLRDYIVKNVSTLAKADFLTDKANEIPDLGTHPFEWFEYWDKDGSQTLEKEELLRALIHTMCQDSNGKPILSMAREMRQLGSILWEKCGFKPQDAIDFMTFMEPQGLADHFLHNDVNCRFFGEDQDV